MTTTYKTIQTIATTGDGGQLLMTDLEALADAAGMTYTQAGAPTTTNDLSHGYAVWDRWRDTTTGNLWVCASNSNGAAVWKQIGGGGLASPLTADLSAGSHKITNLAAPTNPDDAARLTDIPTGVVANPMTSDLSAGSHKITNLAAPVNPNDAARLTDIPTGVVTNPMTSDLSAGSHKITNLAAPTNPNDAARLADIMTGGTATGISTTGDALVSAGGELVYSSGQYAAALDATARVLLVRAETNDANAHSQYISVDTDSAFGFEGSDPKPWPEIVLPVLASAPSVS